MGNEKTERTEPLVHLSPAPERVDIPEPRKDLHKEQAHSKEGIPQGAQPVSSIPQDPPAAAAAPKDALAQSVNPAGETDALNRQITAR